jgi:uncharacterized membrane protein YphA (DoxX/SURF4 family)
MTTNLNRRLARYAPAVLSLFRLVYGLLFAGYGSMILFSWPVRPTWPVQVGAWPGWYAGLIELVTGLLIATGLFTRAAAFIASGEMAVGYFWMHQPRSLGRSVIPRRAMVEFWRFSFASVFSCWSSRAGGATRSTSYGATSSADLSRPTGRATPQALAG